MSDAEHLAGMWWQVLTTAGWQVPESSLVGWVEELLATMTAAEFDPDAGARVGAGLATAGLQNATVPAVSAGVLFRLAEHTDRPDAAARMATVLATLGTGYHLRRAELLAAPEPETESEQRVKLFRAMFERVSIAVALGNVDGTPLLVNPAFVELLGISTEVQKIAPFDHSHPDDMEEIRTLIFDQLVPARTGTVRLERRTLRADGGTGWSRFAITYLADVGGKDYLMAIGEDVTERRQLQDELHRQARVDALTGLANRRELLERMSAMLTAAGPGDRAGLCFVDLDRFKGINDRFGHRIGDQVLIAVAARLENAVRDRDCVVARLGGDEFVVLILPPVDSEQVGAIGADLLEALADPVAVQGHRLPVSASIGAVVTPVTTTDAETLLEAADVSLYQAKTHAQGKVVLHTLVPPA
ncbi:sensor domain-containing diguanylate cyclase [Nocardia sp. NPDC005978]|uniref:sensor domain-containing diguanylate cyclase n=1 Tax=Nocardia sp. NPDC005978 TaxID=3156725 RepID=UPI0033A4C43E